MIGCQEKGSEDDLNTSTLLGYGVQFISYTEAHFRTTGPAGELMIAIAAWIAGQNGPIAELILPGCNAQEGGAHRSIARSCLYCGKVERRPMQARFLAEIADAVGVSKSSVHCVH